MEKEFGRLKSTVDESEVSTPIFYNSNKPSVRGTFLEEFVRNDD